MRRTYRCDWCGKEFIRHDCSTNGKKHLFCSRQCCWNYASKTKNPGHYAELKDLSGVSKHMAKLNATMNATRMTLETRTKLREFHLGKGECNGYSKIFSRLAHRVVAEQLLGRPLESEEVVHHRDGNRYNNAPENLVIFPTVGNHTRFHNEERWFIRQLKQIQEAENACSK